MFDFVGKKKIFIGISLIVILAGLIGYFVKGVQLDIQFQGGTIIQIEMQDDNYEASDAEALVAKTIGKTATVQRSETYSAEDSEKIKLMVLNIASEQTLNEEERSKLIEAIKSEFNVAENAQINVNSIEPFIGHEIRKNAVYAIILASLLVILYVWWRFRIVNGLAAGVFGIIALVHDVLIILAVYILFGIPLNDSFIAATLTVVGYSINDTIIVYDRIRENTRLLKKLTHTELVNKSIRQTLNRTINTTVTTLISVVVIYIFASVNNIQSLMDFTLPLIIGFVAGTYSSIFIACTLYASWMERKTFKKLEAHSSKT
jgi:preprotein translocase subunit SecF